MKMWTRNDHFFLYILKLSLTLNAFTQRRTHFLVLEKLHHRHLIACYCNGLNERMDWWDYNEDDDDVRVRTKDSTSFRLECDFMAGTPAHDRLTKIAVCYDESADSLSAKSTEKEAMWQSCWNIAHFSTVHSPSCHELSLVISINLKHMMSYQLSAHVQSFIMPQATLLRIFSEMRFCDIWRLPGAS